MKFINYTNDGRVVVQHAALILSKLDETDTLELHTMDNAIILLKKDMTLVETRDVLQGMVRLARSMTLDALCNSDAEDKTPLVDESVDDEYEDTITIPVPLEAFGDAGLLGKDLHIQVIDGAVVITEDNDTFHAVTAEARTALVDAVNDAYEQRLQERMEQSEDAPAQGMEQQM